MTTENPLAELGVASMAISSALRFVIFLMICVVSLSGCADSSTSSSPQQWSSAFHPVRIRYSSPWSLIRPTQDSQDKVLVGLIDNCDGKSIVIKVAEDVSRDDLSDASYFNAIKELLVSHNEGNKFVDETNEHFHGASYRRMRFIVNNEKWNHLFCQTAYARRTGEYAVTCQISYPIDSESNVEFPAEIVRLLEQLQLFEDADGS